MRVTGLDALLRKGQQFAGIQQQARAGHAAQRHADAVTLVHLAATDRGPLVAAAPQAAELVPVLRTLPAVRSYTLEYTVTDDGGLVDSLAFARSV